MGPLESAVGRAHEYATRALARFLLLDARVVEYLRAVRGLFLGSEGQYLLSFAESAADELEKEVSTSDRYGDGGEDGNVDGRRGGGRWIDQEMDMEADENTGGRIPGHRHRHRHRHRQGDGEGSRGSGTDGTGVTGIADSVESLQRAAAHEQKHVSQFRLQSLLDLALRTAGGGALEGMRGTGSGFRIGDLADTVRCRLEDSRVSDVLQVLKHGVGVPDDGLGDGKDENEQGRGGEEEAMMNRGPGGKGGGRGGGGGGGGGGMGWEGIVAMRRAGDAAANAVTASRGLPRGISMSDRTDGFVSGAASVASHTTFGSVGGRSSQGTAGSGSAAALMGFAAVSLELVVPWPWSLVLPQQQQLKYQLLFRHLFFCRHVQLALGESWLAL